jgi:hypothetical protein
MVLNSQKLRMSLEEEATRYNTSQARLLMEQAEMLKASAVTMEKVQQEQLEKARLETESAKQLPHLAIEAAEAIHVESMLKAKAETQAARLLTQQYRNLMRPSLTLRVEVTVDHGENGDVWKAKYGDCVGYGPTPETACQDFDNIWAGKGVDDDG